MISKKTVSVIIVCIGLVTSVWLLSKDEKNSTVDIENKDGIVSITDTKEIPNDDWRSILTTVNPDTQNLLASLSNTEKIPDDVTLTNQVSIDLMSQYLSLKQANGELNADDMAEIVNNIMYSKNYSAVGAPIYVSKNLYKIGNDNSSTLEKYKYNMNLIQKVRGAQVGMEPTTLLPNIGGPNEKLALANLDKSIIAGRSFIEDSLKIEVPKSAVTLHLNLINSVSKLISDIEAMRNLEVDPVKSMIALSQYTGNAESFQKSLYELNRYLDKI